MKRPAFRFAVAASVSSFLLACGLSDLGTVTAGDDDSGARPDVFVAADVSAPLDTGTTPSLDAPPPSTPDAADDAPKEAAVDAAADVHVPPVPDAGVDAPVDAHPDTGPPDAGVTFACSSGAATKDCTSCQGSPLGCVMCATDGSGDIFAICVPQGSSCNSSYTPQGYDYCKCKMPSAAACPLPQQECNSYNGGVCVTCGEYSTASFNCKSGGTCHESTASCY